MYELLETLIDISIALGTASLTGSSFQLAAGLLAVARKRVTCHRFARKAM